MSFLTRSFSDQRPLVALLRSEVAAANIATIRQCCYVAIREARQPLVGSEEADLCL